MTEKFLCQIIQISNLDIEESFGHDRNYLGTVGVFYPKEEIAGIRHMKKGLIANGLGGWWSGIFKPSKLFAIDPLKNRTRRPYYFYNVRLRKF